MSIHNVVVGSNFLWRDLGRFGIQALTEHMLHRGCRIEWFTIPMSLLHLLKPTVARARREYIRAALREPRREECNGGYLINRVPWTLIHPIPRLPLLESYFTSRTYLSWRLTPLSTLARRDGIDPIDMLFFDAGGINIYYPFSKRARVTVYRVNDLVAEFPDQVRGRIESEREIIRRADLLLPVSPPIYDEVVRIRGSATGVHLLSNGFDAELFNRPYAQPAEYAVIPEPRAVLVGQINSWYDLDLLRRVATLRPAVSFCIVGRGKLPSDLPSNVYDLGTQPHDRVPAYLKHAAVGLMPFKDVPRVYKCDFIKFYEYIASGLPIVSQPPLAMLQRMKPYTWGTTSAEEYAAAIDAALSLTTSERERLRLKAQQFSWESVYAHFEHILKQEGLTFA